MTYSFDKCNKYIGYNISLLVWTKEKNIIYKHCSMGFLGLTDRCNVSESGFTGKEVQESTSSFTLLSDMILGGMLSGTWETLSWAFNLSFWTFLASTEQGNNCWTWHFQVASSSWMKTL